MLESSFLKIFNSKYFIGPIIFFTLIMAGIVFYFSNIEDKIIFPHKGNYKFSSYTDNLNGGKTQIIEQSTADSILTFRFQLNEGFHSPYAGFSLSPTKTKYIDAAKYNQISLCMRGEKIDRLGIALYTPLYNYEGNLLQDENLYHSYLNISDKKKTYTIPFNQLKHPEWWEDLNPISKLKTNKLELNHVLHINIGSAYSPDIEGIKTLKVYSIAFTRNNKPLFIWLAVIYFLIILLNCLLLFWFQIIKKKNTQITVSYKAIEINDDNNVNDDACIQYINKNFNNSELNLADVAKKIGIPQRKISTVINERYNCNFKTYINRIRIKESQRLLSQTELNIGEIAYKVGFNNQSHFNRVFKSETLVNPSEYRDNLA